MNLVANLAADLLDSINDEGALAELPRRIAVELEALNVNLQLVSPHASSAIASFGLETSAKRLYEEHYWKNDDWAEQYESLSPGRVADREHLISDDVFLKTEIYYDFMRLQGDLFRGIGFISDLGNEYKLIFGAVRARRQSRFDPRLINELQALQPLLTHMVRARLRNAGGRSSLAEQLLDEDPDAILVTSSAGSVQYQNAAAARMIGARMGLTLASGSILSASDARQAAELAQALRWACAGKGGRALTIMWGERAFLLEVDSLGGPHEGFAIVRVRNEAERLSRAVARATHAYALSKAEARLAEALLAGMTAKNYAEQRGVALTTVRSQVRSLFNKTGVNRQAELFVALRGA